MLVIFAAEFFLFRVPSLANWRTSTSEDVRENSGEWGVYRLSLLTNRTTCINPGDNPRAGTLTSLRDRAVLAQITQRPGRSLAGMVVVNSAGLFGPSFYGWLELDDTRSSIINHAGLTVGTDALTAEVYPTRVSWWLLLDLGVCLILAISLEAMGRRWRAWRRARAGKLGVCAACGYAKGTTAICPECGAADQAKPPDFT